MESWTHFEGGEDTFEKIHWSIYDPRSVPGLGSARFEEDTSEKIHWFTHDPQSFHDGVIT